MKCDKCCEKNGTQHGAMKEVEECPVCGLHLEIERLRATINTALRYIDQVDHDGEPRLNYWGTVIQVKQILKGQPAPNTPSLTYAKDAVHNRDGVTTPGGRESGHARGKGE